MYSTEQATTNRGVVFARVDQKSSSDRSSSKKTSWHGKHNPFLGLITPAINNSSSIVPSRLQCIYKGARDGLLSLQTGCDTLVQILYQDREVPPTPLSSPRHLSVCYSTPRGGWPAHQRTMCQNNAWPFSSWKYSSGAGLAQII